MKKIAPHLHKFIHALNKAQKRSFTGNVASHRDAHHLQLFYFLTTQKVYDEGLLEDFLKKSEFDKTASKTIAYLFDKLVSLYAHATLSLGDTLPAEAWANDFERLMKRSEMLYKLGGDKEAIEVLKKLKKKTRKQDSLTYLMRILEMEISFHKYNNFKFVSHAEYVLISKEHLDTVKKYEYLWQCEYLHSKLMHHINNDEREEVEKFFHEEFALIEDEKYASYYSSLLFYRAKFSYYNYVSDKIKMKEINKSFDIFLDSNDIYIKNNIQLYFNEKSNIVLQRMELIDGDMEAASVIVEDYSALLANSLLEVSDSVTIKNIKFIGCRVLVRLQLMIIYKRISLLNIVYLKEIEDQMVRYLEETSQDNSVLHSINLINIIFFKILLKKKSSLEEFQAFFDAKESPIGIKNVYETSKAMVLLIYYYNFFDIRVFEVQFANFKRRKISDSGEGTSLLIDFFNAIKRDKYQRNRRNALKYFDLFRTFENTHKNYIEVSFWLKYGFLNDHTEQPIFLEASSK